jgi:RHS repeat-associated protein
MIAEVANPSGAITRRYVHGPGSDEPLVWYEGAGTTDRRWLHADQRGSIVAVSNGTGAMTDINSYDEYGVPAASNAGRFGYTGQAWLPGLDMYYYKARIYAPMIGRFMQPDPIGYEGGMNLYTYVGGDPVNGIDTLGLKLDRPCVWSNGCFTIGGHFVPSSGQNAGPTSAGETEVISQWRWVPDSTFTINLNSGSWFNFDFEFPIPEKSEDDTYYLTEANCWRSGLLLRATGNALVDIGGVGTAIGGTGVAVGTGLGIFGAVTGNVPAAGFGAIVAGTAAPIATAGVATQFVGSVTAFIGGESSKTLIRNASGAVINRIPFAPIWVKSGLKEGAKRISDYVPEVRICHANRY